MTKRSTILVGGQDDDCHGALQLVGVEVNDMERRLTGGLYYIYVYAAFAKGKDLFASVGADGSVRMFDLRSLVHSTIIYEVR